MQLRNSQNNLKNFFHGNSKQAYKAILRSNSKFAPLYV